MDKFKRHDEKTSSMKINRKCKRIVCYSIQCINEHHIDRLWDDTNQKSCHQVGIHVSIAIDFNANDDVTAI